MRGSRLGLTVLAGMAFAAPLAHGYGIDHCPDIYQEGDLDAFQTVPPSGSPGRGTISSFVMFTIDPTKQALFSYQLAAEDLTGPITAAHIRSGRPGENGPLVRDITQDVVGGTASGTWLGLSDTEVAELMAGEFYVELYTGPQGLEPELRAQLHVEQGIRAHAPADGSQVVPPAGSPAVGTVFAVLDRRGLVIEATFDGLTGPIVGLEVRHAPAGANGPLLRDLTAAVQGNTARTVWPLADGLTPKIVQDFLAHELYVEARTGTFPQGEARAQMLPMGEDVLAARPDGLQTVPPSGSAATGTAALAIRHNRLSAEFRITAEGLSGPLTEATLRSAPPGLDGPVVLDLLPSFTGNTAAGTLCPLTSELMAEIYRGHLYVSLHTAAHPQGELRGQFEIESGPNFDAVLDGDQMVPPNSTSATGVVSIFLRHGQLHIEGTASDLTSALTEVHLHRGLPGTNGPVVFDLTPTIDGSSFGAPWLSIGPADIEALLRGELYVDLHTGQNPGGELRGQAMPEEHLVAMTQSPAVLGQPTTFQVTNAAAGDTVHFTFSTAGEGAGPCPPLLGGTCLDILSPVTVLGTAVADACGEASLQVTIPSGAPTGDMFGQAAIPRGPGGVDSVTSHTTITPVTANPAPSSTD